MATVEQLGPLIRLWGLTTAQLPSADETPDGLAPFLISVLQEAVPFVDSIAPKLGLAESHGASRLWKPKGQKSFKESGAKVHLSERTISTADLSTICSRTGPPPAVTARHHDGHPTHPETWISRRSVHSDAAVPGTASWAEFRQSFKEAHAETEDAFTPSVVGAREAATWDCGAVEAEEGGEIWGHFTLKIEEMRHKIGKPLKDRTFPVLQMTCAAMARRADSADAATTQHHEQPEFLVVSITVDDFDRAPSAELSREKGVVLGAYASVERIRKLTGTDEIEWIMTTTSDARGVLPQWVQNMAVPGQIAKDVPMFLSWIARERKGEAHPAHADDHVEEVADRAVDVTKGKEDAVPKAAEVTPTAKDEPKKDESKKDEAKEQNGAAVAVPPPAAVAPEAPKPEEAAEPAPAPALAKPDVVKAGEPAPPAAPAPAETLAEAPAEASVEATAEAPAEVPAAEPKSPLPPQTPKSPKTQAPPPEKREIVTSESVAPVTAEVATA